MRTTRRTFLGAGGASVAGCAFNLLPSRAIARPTPSNGITLGIVGLGGMGMAHAQSFLSLGDVTVRAVCDADAGKMADAKARVDARYGNRDCLAIGDWRALCGRSDLDAVVIAVPDHAHARIGRAALSSGKDVYGEIPFAHTLTECGELLRSVTETRRVWQSGSWQRTDPLFRRAVAAVRLGRLGSLARVEVGLPGGGRGPAVAELDRRCPEGLDWRAWLGDAPNCDFPGVCDYHWRWVRAWGGGMLGAWAGHHIDVALWGADVRGDPVSVSGAGCYPSDGLYDTATAFRFTAAYADGLSVTVADGGRLPGGVGVRWIGADGRWIWVTRGSLLASTPELLEAVDTSALGPEMDLRRNFVDCVKARRSPIVSAATACRATRLALLGDAAMRANPAIGAV